MSWLRIVAVALLLSSVATAAPTRAQKKEAATRFQRGVGLYKDGDFGAALSEFREAYRLAPHYEVLYNIGLTQRRLYLYGQSVKSLHQYLKLGGSKVQSARREAVQRELKEIEALTAEVTVVVPGATAEITVDDEKVGASPLPEALLLRPGKHVFIATRGKEVVKETRELVSGSRVELTLSPVLPVEASGKLIINSNPGNAIISVDGMLQGEAPVVLTLPAGGHTVTADQDGYETTQLEVALAAGQSRDVTIELRRGGGAAYENMGPRRRVPLVGIVVASAGAAALAGGVAFTFQAQSASRQMSDLFATGGDYDSRAQGIEASGHTANTLSWLLGVTGGATLITGVIMIVATLVADPDAELSFLVVPSSQGLSMSWGLTW